MEFYNVTDFNTSLDISKLVSNDTSCCFRRYTAGNVVGSLVTLSIAFIAIAGNVAVVTASFWNEALRVQTSNFLLVYLSTVDILTAIIIMIPSAIAVAADYWPLGSRMCKIQAIFNYMFACSSTVNLTVISIDRAYAILDPFKYISKMTLKVIIRLCIFIFVFTFIVGMACGGPDWTSYNYTEAVCAMDYQRGSAVIYVFNISCFCCFYVPSIVIGICNFLIIKTARRSSKNTRSLFIRRNNAQNNLKESVQSDVHMKKTIKSLVVVVIVFFISYTPYALGKQFKVIFSVDMPPWFNYLSTICIFFASATNPFIYAILRKDYRDAFKTLPRTLKEKLSMF